MSRVGRNERHERSDAAPPRLGVLVPCRDEAAVIERKLRNLSALRWPAARASARANRATAAGPGEAGAEHVVLIVDDHSADGTHERAQRFLGEPGIPRPPGVAFEVVRNAVRPGKTGALEHGLARLAGRVDIVVLTDADVVFDDGALEAVAAAFAERAELGMVSGAQVFVRDLAPDGVVERGAARGADGAPAVPAAGLFDRLTALVRRAESRRGKLFSVHGQLLAWRAALDLRPNEGVAADDIDLMLQARARGTRVELLPAARFFEVKTVEPAPWSAPPGATSQAVRRARAYVQVVRRLRRPLRGGALDELQWLFYRHVPTAAPWLLAAGLVLAPLLAGLVGGRVAAAVLLGVELGLLATPLGRRLVRLMRVIARATSLERRQPMSDHWEMARS